MSNKDYCVFLCSLFQAVLLHKKGTWEREMKLFVSEKFRREELPSPLPLGSYSESTPTVSLLALWVDQDIHS